MAKLCWITVLLVSHAGMAQQVITQPNDTIRVGTLSTVFLYFNSEVGSHVLGSGLDEQGHPDVLLLSDKNRLDLIARVPEFNTTNLPVETALGDVYNFILVYDEEVDNYIWQVQGSAAIFRNTFAMDAPEPEPKEVIAIGEALPINVEEVKVFAEQVADLPDVKSDIGTVIPKERITYWVNGIYTRENYIFFRISIENKGNLKHDVDLIRFVLKGKGGKSLKNAATGSPEKEELYIYNRDKTQIPKGESINQVWAFEKFTFGKKKRLVIEVCAVNGDRCNEVVVKHKKLLKAKPL